MDLATTKALLTYGPLGLMVLGLAIALRIVYNSREKDRAAWDAERRAWDEKYAKTSNDWITKYHEYASAQSAVLESFMKKIDSRGRSSSSSDHERRNDRRKDDSWEPR